MTDSTVPVSSDEKETEVISVSVAEIQTSIMAMDTAASILQTALLSRDITVSESQILFLSNEVANVIRVLKELRSGLADSDPDGLRRFLDNDRLEIADTGLESDWEDLGSGDLDPAFQ